MIPKRMAAVHFRGSGRVAIDQVDTPTPSGRDVLVRVEAAAICGTDRENLEGAGQSTVPGHECAGEVVSIDRPSWIRVGTRVAVNCHVTCLRCEHCLKGDLYFCDELKVIGFDRDGGFAEYMLVPEQCCMPLPDDIALIVSKMTGMKAAVVDLSDYRLDQARALGADMTLNADRTDVVRQLAAWTNERGLDACFDCVGSDKVARQALSAVRKRGTVIVVGVSHTLTIDPWEDLICRELTILGTRNFNVTQFDGMIALLRTGLPATRVVSHRFALKSAEEAFEVFRRGNCEKVLFTTSASRSACADSHGSPEHAS